MKLELHLRWQLFLIAYFAVLSASPLASGQNPTASNPEATDSLAKSVSDGRITRTSSDRWVPPDIDDVTPPVSQKMDCPLSDISRNAGLKMKEFLDDLGSFTATETIVHQTVTKSGDLRAPETQKYEYLVSVEESPEGPHIQEYRGRDLNPKPEPSSDGIRIEGTMSLALIFHPSHEADFRMTCEGLGLWLGQPAWQIRFEELPTRTHPMIALELQDNKQYELALRGRAWILADTFGVAEIETDLSHTIPQVGLRLQHQIVEYGPAFVPDRHAVLWLPLRTQIFMDFKHHRFYQSQTYTGFHLFSVNVQQEFGGAR